jgi:hypothetical protein
VPPTSSPVRVNGTVAFRSAAPVRTRDRVCALLARRTDWSDVAPVRSAPWVGALAGRLATTGNVEVSFFAARADFPAALPWRPEAGRVTVVHADRRHAIAVDDEPRTSYATPVLEGFLGLRVTSRGAATVLAVAERLG